MEHKDVDIYEKLYGQITGLYQEMSVLSKKSPNDGANKFKLSLINNLLSQANLFLNTKYKPFDEFEIFDIDNLPSNSDVVFVLSQYIQCFNKYKMDNGTLDYNKYYWNVKPLRREEANSKGFVQIRTSRPTNLEE